MDMAPPTALSYSIFNTHLGERERGGGGGGGKRREEGEGGGGGGRGGGERSRE